MRVDGHKRAAGRLERQDVTEFSDVKHHIFATSLLFSAVLVFPCRYPTPSLPCQALSRPLIAILGDQQAPC